MRYLKFDLIPKVPELELESGSFLDEDVLEITFWKFGLVRVGFEQGCLKRRRSGVVLETATQVQRSRRGLRAVGHGDQIHLRKVSSCFGADAVSLEAQ